MIEGRNVLPVNRAPIGGEFVARHNWHDYDRCWLAAVMKIALAVIAAIMLESHLIAVSVCSELINPVFRLCWWFAFISVLPSQLFELPLLIFRRYGLGKGSDRSISSGQNRKKGIACKTVQLYKIFMNYFRNSSKLATHLRKLDH